MKKQNQPLNPTIYLAASLLEDHQMIIWEKKLHLLGYPTINRWIFKELRATWTTQQSAEHDYQDLKSADVVLISTMVPSTNGGRHTELGLALGLGKRVIMVGGYEENCFQWLPGVEMVKGLDDAIELLKR